MASLSLSLGLLVLCTLALVHCDLDDVQVRVWGLSASNLKVALLSSSISSLADSVPWPLSLCAWDCWCYAPWLLYTVTWMTAMSGCGALVPPT